MCGGVSSIHPWQGAGTPTFSPKIAADYIIMSRWVLSEPRFPRSNREVWVLFHCIQLLHHPGLL